MSDSNRVNLAFVEESTFGTTPAGPPTLQNLRFTGESLKQDTGSTTSNEIRSDRNITDLIRNALSASGDLNYEFSYGSYDSFLEAGLMSADWTAVVTMAAGPSMTIASNVVTRATGSFVTDGFAVGRWVRMLGWNTAVNNGYFKISAVAATTLTLTGGTLTNQGSAETDVEIEQGAMITNGTELRSFAIERQFQDLSSEFTVLNGMCIEQISMEIAADQVITGSFAFLGKTEDSATATAGTGTNTAASTTGVMNGIDNVNKVLENGTSFSITGLSLAIKNNLRQRLQVATLGPISIGSGECTATGTLRAYFTSKAIMDKYRDFTATSISLVLVDSASNAYVVDFPRVKFSSGQQVAGGKNTDIIADLPFTAYMHATELVTVRIQRWAV